MNLEARFRVILMSYTIAIVFVTTACILAGAHYIEDTLLNHWVQEECNRLSSLLEKDEHQLQDIRMFPGIQASVGGIGLSTDLYKVVTELPLGSCEIRSPIECHVAVGTIPGKAERLYVILDAEKHEVLNTWEPTLYGGLALFAFTIIIAALAIATRAAALALAPMNRLVNMLRQQAPESAPSIEASQFTEVEMVPLVKTLNESFERIQEFLAREKAFTRDASHELRSPLTVIKNSLEVMEATASEETATRRAPMLRIGRAVRDMEHLIETFLTLAREERHCSVGTCALGEVVERVVADNRYLLKDKNVSVTVEVEPQAEEQPLPFDETVVTIAVANLVRNAFTHTTMGQVTIRTEACSISVSDEGEGIGDEQLAQLGEPFTSKGQTPGLGLSIVNSLTKRHGWGLSFDGNSDKGTTVSLTFDCQEADEQADIS